MKSNRDVVLAALSAEPPPKHDWRVYGYDHEKYVLPHAAPELVEQLKQEAQFNKISLQEYAHALTHPIIITVSTSQGTESGGDGTASLSITCTNLAGNEVL